MKHKSLFLWVLAVMLLPWVAKGQSSLRADYTFATGVNTSYWYTLTSSATTLLGASQDDVASAVFDIGFSFDFGENTYTKFSVNSNGYFKLGDVAVTNVRSAPFGASRTSENPKICGVCGADLHTYTTGSIRKQNFDSVMVVEYDISFYSNQNYQMQWQIQLFRNTGKARIVFNTNTLASIPSSRYFQTGFQISDTSYLAINTTTHAATYGGTTNYTTTNSAWPGEGRYYEVTPVPVTCPKVQDLNAQVISSDSALITWRAGSTETAWIVSRGSWDTLVIDTALLFTGLQPAANYIYSVRGICSTTDTSRATLVSFTTPCAMITLPWTENFDSYTTSTTAATGVHPNCWDLVRWCHNTTAQYTTANEPAIYYGSTYASSGNYSLRMYYRCMYALPIFNGDIRKMEVSLKLKSGNASYYELVVGTVSDVTNPQTFVALDTLKPSTTTYTEYTVSLANAPANASRIVFVNALEGAQNYAYSQLYIDDLNVSFADMPQVSRLAATTDSNEATLHWIANDAVMTQRYLIDDGMSVYTTADTFYTFNNLQADSTYTYRVAAVGTTNDTSSWTTIKVHTPCSKISLPWSENFDNLTTSTTAATGVTPPCWHMLGWDFNYSAYQTATYKPQVYYGSANAQSGNYSLRLYGRSLYALPAFAIDSLRGLAMEFSVKQASASVYPLEVAVMDDLNDKWSYHPIDTILHSALTYQTYLYTFENTPATAKYIVFRNIYQPLSGNNYNYPYATNYIDDISVFSADCLPVTNIRAFSMNDTIALSWHSRSTESAWIVRYGNNETTVYDTTVIIDGLNYNTLYHIEVAPYCASGDTGSFVGIDHYSACGPMQIPYTENFDNFTTITTAETGVEPRCWTFVAADTTITTSNTPHLYYGSAYASSGYYSLKMNGRCIYAMPQFNVTTLNNLMMRFTLRQGATTARLVVGTLSSLTDTSSFTAIDTLYNTTTTAKETKVVGFSNAPSNARYIAFRNVSTTNAATSLNYIDDVELVSSQCTELVSGLQATAISGDSVIVSWNSGSISGSYLVEYGDTAIQVYDTFYVVSGLNSRTTYSFDVSNICTNGDTSFARSTSVTTPCGKVNLPWSENFESFAANVIPDCWTFTGYDTVVSQADKVTSIYNHNETGRGVNQNLTFTCSGTKCLRMMTRSTIALPMPNANALSDIVLSFNMRMAQNQGQIVVGVMSNPHDASTFVAIDTVQNDTASFWRHIDVSLAAAPATAKYIAFRNRHTQGFDVCTIFLDDVEMNLVPCQPVSGLVANAPIADTVILNWNRGTNDVIYLVDTGGTAYMTVSTNSMTLGGRTPNTSYTFRVAPICMGGDTGLWSTTYVTTPCLKRNIPYFDNFDSYTTRTTSSTTQGFTGVTPHCWVEPKQLTYRNLYNQYPQVHYGNSHSGNYSLSINYDGYLSLPELNIDTINGLAMDFYMSGSSSPIEIGVLDNLNNDIATYQAIDRVQGTGTFYVRFDSASSTAKYITFHQLTNALRYIDDIDVYVNSCPRPMNVSVDSILSSSAMVHWSAESYQNNFEIEYVASGAAHGTGTTVYATSNRALLVNLSPYTTYDVYVRGLCTASDTGRWSFVTSFTTPLCDSIEMASTVGSGTTGSSAYYPIGYGGAQHTLVETIIDASTLSTFTGSDITAFDFLTSGTTLGSYHNNITIWMGHTTKTEFTSQSDWVLLNSSFTKVYEGSLNFNTSGWHRFAFDTVFTWNGTDNVVMIVDRNGTTAGSTNTNPIFTTSITSPLYKTLYISGTSDFDPETISSPGARDSAIGAMRFISCGGGCANPVVNEVTNFDYANATVSWMGTAANYQVSWRSNSDASWGNDVDVQGYSYNITGLQPATEYYVRVRSVCDTVNGTPTLSDYRMVTFTTDSLPCFAPTDFANTASGFTTATFEWTPGTSETTWQIHVWDANIDSIYTVNTHPATIGGLNPAMSYSAAVRALCGNGAVESEYSDTITFSTDQCATPTNIETTDITQHSVHVNWTGTAGTYEIQYGDRNFPTGTGTTVNVNGNSYDISGLEADGDYDVIVRAICEEGIMSEFSERIQFRTQQEGIDAVDQLNVNIYPNPATESATITISGVTGMYVVSIIDLTGHTVKSQTIHCDGGCTTALNVEALTAGAYFVRVSGNGTNSVRKLVVK